MRLKQYTIGLFLVMSILVFTSTRCFADWNWHKRTYLLNCKRDQACSFAIGNCGYICTGSDTNNITLNDLWEYNATNNTWTQKANLLGPARRSAFAFSINGIGYVGGGIADSNTTGTIFGDFYAYNPTSNTWTAKANYSSTGNNVYRSAATSCNGKGYLIGGRNSWSSNSSLSEYDPVSDTWLLKASFPGVPTSSGGRDGGAAFSVNNKVYFGTGRDDSFFERDFWEFDPINNAWIQKKNFPGSGRFCGVGFSIKNKGFIGLGTDGGFLKDIYVYDYINDQWDFANNFDGAGRRNACSFVIGDSAYVSTGKSAGGTKQDLYVMYWENIAPTGNDSKFENTNYKISPTLISSDKNEIHIEGLTEEKKLFEIYSLNGERIFSKWVSNEDASFEIELNNSGNYITLLNNVKIGMLTQIKQ